MSEIIQTTYIKILNPIYDRYVSKLSEGVRMAYINCAFIALEIYFLLLFSKSFKPILFTYAQRNVLASFLLLAVALLSMKEPLKPVKWKVSLLLTYIISALGLIITGFMHPIGSGYMSFGFVMLLVYMPLYMVWSNRGDYEVLFDIVARSNLSVGSIYTIYCFIIYHNEIMETDGDRFKGTIADANLYGLIGMAMVCSALYLAYRYRKSKARLLFCIAGGALGLSVVVLGQSRSALLVVIGAIFAYLWFVIKLHCKNLKSYRLLTAALFIVIVLGAAALAVAFSENDGTEGVNPENKGFISRILPAGKDLNQYSSGRIQIWKNYAVHLNMTGNNFDEVNWNELTGDTVKHAHNNTLEYGYRCGLPVAILFDLLELVAGIIAIIFLFSYKRRRSYQLYVIIAMIMYLVMSLIDIATLPMERYAPYAFYLALTGMFAPIIFRDAGADTDENYEYKSDTENC